MPAYAGFASLIEYIERRCRAAGLSPNALAIRLGYPRNYIHGLLLGRYKPSRTRAEALARAFGDPPEIIFILAGLQALPAAPDRVTREITSLAGSLPRKGKLELLAFLRYLVEKYRPV